MKNRAIDLFSGAGGLSLGLKMAGWDVGIALEFDPGCIETHRRNMPETLHICDDIRDVDFGQYQKLDLVAGGPPCQPFSVSGKQMGKRDVRDMVPEFVRVVREVKPRAFLLENVAGLASPRFRPYLDAKLKELESLGYIVQWRVLNAADYGVPQKRLRLFVVGVPQGTVFEFPRKTHGPSCNNGYVTVREALRKVSFVEPNRAKVVFARNPILRKSPYAGMLLNGKGRPLNLDAPSLTIPATAGGNRTHILDPKGILVDYHRRLLRGGKPRVGEVLGCRRLTIEESARLQTFPDWFEFVGRKSQRYAQIGNAVPPLLAQAIGKSVLDALQPKIALQRRKSKETT